MIRWRPALGCWRRETQGREIFTCWFDVALCSSAHEMLPTRGTVVAQRLL
jgi:hypothetical protein